MGSSVAYLLVDNPKNKPFDRAWVVEYLTAIGHREVLPHTQYDQTAHDCSLVVWGIEQKDSVPESVIHDIIGQRGHVEHKWQCPVCGIVRSENLHPSEPHRNKEYFCDCPTEEEAEILEAVAYKHKALFYRACVFLLKKFST